MNYAFPPYNFHKLASCNLGRRPESASLDSTRYSRVLQDRCQQPESWLWWWIEWVKTVHCYLPFQDIPFRVPFLTVNVVCCHPLVEVIVVFVAGANGWWEPGDGLTDGRDVAVADACGEPLPGDSLIGEPDCAWAARGRVSVRSRTKVATRASRCLIVDGSMVFLSFVWLDFSYWLADFNSSTEDANKEDVRIIVYEVMPNHRWKLLQNMLWRTTTYK